MQVRLTCIKVHPHFVHRMSDGNYRMYWKISIDMKTPLTMSEGHLDPYDGYITYRLLQEVRFKIFSDAVSTMLLQSHGFDIDAKLDCEQQRAVRFDSADERHGGD